MMHRSFIALVGFLVVLLVGAVGVYAYDSARDNRIAHGVTVGGLDVGGMTAGEARTTLKRRFADPVMQREIVVRYKHRSFKLDPSKAGVRADVDGMVDEAVSRSRKGNLVSRTFRDLTGGDVHADVPARVSYDHQAVGAFIKRVGRGVDRPAQNAKVGFSGAGISKIPSRKGVALRTSRLEDDLQAELTAPDADGVVKPTVSITKPKVTTKMLAAKYPAIITVDRGGFTLHFFRHLKEVRSYQIAVGRQGLETPAGLYDIQSKEVNPSWHVPNSSWAGSLAGQTIPPGPQDPLKARWMGFNGGAGIHGTDDVGSLGSAASHGCIRMSIPDVIELYDQVKVGTPVYIG